MPQWLLKRLFKAKKEQSKPRFAFQGTINWMRSLALLVNSDLYTSDVLSKKYASVTRRSINPDADTKVFENILMAYHQLASLYSINAFTSHHYDTCRSAIISWYYSTYFCCSAMVAASSGSSQETHAATAKVWHADIVLKNLVQYPFDLYLSNLVSTTVESEISKYRGENRFSLNTYPENTEQAHGAIVAYLSGTGDHEREKAEKKVKDTAEYKGLEVDNFRKKEAQELRDRRLSKGYVNYLIQSIRYRGKANYRDSVFLSYGDNNEEKIKQFTEDLLTVSKAFIHMTSHYVSKRVERNAWDLFLNDLKEYSRLSIGIDDLKI